jgi:hypothetical protein
VPTPDLLLRCGFRKGYQGVNGTLSRLQMALIAGRAVIGPEGSPPPGEIYSPTIMNLRSPGKVLGK